MTIKMLLRKDGKGALRVRVWKKIGEKGKKKKLMWV